MRYDKYEYKSENEGVTLGFHFEINEKTLENKKKFLLLLKQATKDLEQEIKTN